MLIVQCLYSLVLFPHVNFKLLFFVCHTAIQLKEKASDKLQWGTFVEGGESRADVRRRWNGWRDNMKKVSSQPEGKPWKLLKSAFLYSVCTCITSAEQVDQEVAAKEPTQPINLPNKEEDSSISIQAPTTTVCSTLGYCFSHQCCQHPHSRR